MSSVTKFHSVIRFSFIYVNDILRGKLERRKQYPFRNASMSIIPDDCILTFFFV